MMIKSILPVFLMSSALLPVSAQITYHHYLDYTVQWDEISVRQELNTAVCDSNSPDYIINYHMHTYMDGDTMIGGKQYYRMMTFRTDTARCTNGLATSVDTLIYLRYFLHEDSNNHLYQNLNGQDSLLWDFNIVLGDSFPNCKLAWMDTVWLGPVALRRWHCNCFGGGVYSSVIEGVGTSNGFDAQDWMCAVSVDSSIGLVCYARQSYMLQTDTGIACNLVAVSGNNDEQTDLTPSIWPNPTQGHFHYWLPQALLSGARLSVNNILGQQLLAQTISMQQSEFDISPLPSGIYLLRFSAGGQNYIQRVVKQ